ncbi:hypothetical protein HM1_1729 [Heliomicrobium modesticaldum Ice1]|uniref:Uncharacterized protein n=1 Tax=Heliobacterium modesticaldum (strain ATCC 51547 / Ice1) TaxID=498761 RepID=B0TEP7_HELMI|nr:hypothetical protein HM1_1729 [Heliomicrobium modesticaldum Ice1]
MHGHSLSFLILIMCFLRFPFLLSAFCTHRFRLALCAKNNNGLL